MKLIFRNYTTFTPLWRLTPFSGSSASNLLISDMSVPSVTWQYRFIVILTLECPKRTCAVFGFMPLPSLQIPLELSFLWLQFQLSRVFVFSESDMLLRPSGFYVFLLKENHRTILAAVLQRARYKFHVPYVPTQ